MIGNLSPKQKQALFLIKETIKKTGKPPTLGELRELLRLKYINSVTHLINKLEEKGYIRRKRGEPRGIELASQEKKVVGIPLIGAVACGKPLLAQENIEGYISVDKNWLRGNPQDFFFLRAVGDSMNSAGIDDGDLTLIKIQSTANPNDQVVALIEDEATIKIYKPKEDYVALVPSSKNRQHKPIILREDFLIQGVVKMVLKKRMLES